MSNVSPVSSVLLIRVNGKEVCTITQADVPCEKTLPVNVRTNGVLELTDREGVTHTHELGQFEGWYHFSIRVHPNLACQIDCVITESQEYEPAAFANGQATGIRFQPFFLTGANTRNEDLYGKGLFARGLHFSGIISSGNLVLSCECDSCKKSFQIRSYHAGFSNAGYFYSGSGQYTITVSDQIRGCPVALSEPNSEDLATLEATLPLAPDGTPFKYTNPFRCPHCFAPYIDFGTFPKDRSNEYYGNYFIGSELLHY